jgi:hypothetical protein
VAEGLNKPRPVGALKAQETYAHRFRAAYALLAVAFWGVVAAGTVAYTRGSHETSGPPWSDWKPTAEGFTAVEQIAGRVGPEYRLDTTGEQLAIVHPRSVEQGQLGGFAVGDGVNYKPIVAQRTLFYEICGSESSPSCGLPGAPSNVRDVLLRREALELALYTFKYVKGYDSIVAFLPPRPVAQSSAPAESDSTTTLPKQMVVLFRENDLKEQLRRPLRETLALPPPLTPSTLGTVELSRVVELTTPHFFNAEPQSLPDGTRVLVLDPVVGPSIPSQ